MSTSSDDSSSVDDGASSHRDDGDVGLMDSPLTVADPFARPRKVERKTKTSPNLDLLGDEEDEALLVPFKKKSNVSTLDLTDLIRQSRTLTGDSPSSVSGDEFSDPDGVQAADRGDRLEDSSASSEENSSSPLHHENGSLATTECHHPDGPKTVDKSSSDEASSPCSIDEGSSFPSPHADAHLESPSSPEERTINDDVESSGGSPRQEASSGTVESSSTVEDAAADPTPSAAKQNPFLLSEELLNSTGEAAGYSTAMMELLHHFKVNPSLYQRIRIHQALVAALDSYYASVFISGIIESADVKTLELLAGIAVTGKPNAINVYPFDPQWLQLHFLKLFPTSDYGTEFGASRDYSLIVSIYINYYAKLIYSNIRKNTDALVLHVTENEEMLSESLESAGFLFRLLQKEIWPLLNHRSKRVCTFSTFVLLQMLQTLPRVVLPIIQTHNIPVWSHLRRLAWTSNRPTTTYNCRLLFSTLVNSYWLRYSHLQSSYGRNSIVIEDLTGRPPASMHATAYASVDRPLMTKLSLAFLQCNFKNERLGQQSGLRTSAMYLSLFRYLLSFGPATRVAIMGKYPRFGNILAVCEAMSMIVKWENATVGLDVFLTSMRSSSSGSSADGTSSHAPPSSPRPKGLLGKKGSVRLKRRLKGSSRTRIGPSSTTTSTISPDSNGRSCPLIRLDAEVLVHIMSYLQPEDIGRLECTCAFFMTQLGAEDPLGVYKAAFERFKGASPSSSLRISGSGRSLTIGGSRSGSEGCDGDAAMMSPSPRSKRKQRKVSRSSSIKRPSSGAASWKSRLVHKIASLREAIRATLPKNLMRLFERLHTYLRFSPGHEQAKCACEAAQLELLRNVRVLLRNASFYAYVQNDGPFYNRLVSICTTNSCPSLAHKAWGILHDIIQTHQGALRDIIDCGALFKAATVLKDSSDQDGPEALPKEEEYLLQCECLAFFGKLFLMGHTRPAGSHTEASLVKDVERVCRFFSKHDLQEDVYRIFLMTYQLRSGRLFIEAASVLHTVLCSPHCIKLKKDCIKMESYVWAFDKLNELYTARQLKRAYNVRMVREQLLDKAEKEKGLSPEYMTKKQKKKLEKKVEKKAQKLEKFIDKNYT